MLVVEGKLVSDGAGKPRVVARAIAGNASDLADKSDDTAAATEGENPIVGRPAREAHGHILGHGRAPSGWPLVIRLATWAEVETVV